MPDKFGIKFWITTDVLSKYLLKGYPYLSKDETRPYGRTAGEHVALFRLNKPYCNIGRNVSLHNCNTSLKLIKQMRNAVISYIV